MSGETQPALRRIRTFKEDIAAAEGRSTSQQPTDSSSDAVAPAAVSVPSIKAAPAKAFAAAAPSEHIPAFHELKKQTGTTEHIATAKPASASLPKINVRAKKRDLSAPVKASGGVMITDTKRAKVNFFSELMQSISNWMNSLGGGKKKTLTYNVADTELRKGVVQKATSKSGSIFTADNETLKEEIRRRKMDQGHSTMPVAEPHLSWTPRTETGYPLLPGDVTVPPPKRVVVEFKKAAVPQPEIIEPVTPPMWEAAPHAVPAPSAPVAPPFVPEPAPRYAAVGPSPEVQESVVSIEPVAQFATSAPQALPLRQVLNEKARRFVNNLRVNTNTLTLSIAGVLLFVAIVALAANLVLKMVNTGVQNAPTLEPASTLLPLETVTDLEITERTRTAVLASLANATLVNGVPQEFRLVDTEGAAIATQDVLALAGFSNNLNLNQTITDAHLVTLNGQRGIVFTVTDATTAFGALLSWEPVMLPSLAEFLGVETIDGPATFTDQTVGTTDVRVLTLSGSQRVTYGFIAGNTVLITEDIGAFNIMVGSGL